MENKKIITLCDTLLLAAGNTHSLFLDAQYKTELEKARKERIRRSVKAGKANTTYENVNDIVELINATSDYKKERFTLDIPLSDGPWKFHGLPGLIVKVEDSEGLFRFIAIGLEQYKDNEIYIVADKVDYDKSTLKNFNLFAEREKVDLG